MPIAGQVDLTAFAESIKQDFFQWIQENASNHQLRHSREYPTFKLWHLNGSLSSASKEQHLFTFYELDSPTKTETNIAKNQKTVFLSSRYACDVFEAVGCNNIVHAPLGFDSGSFCIKERRAEDDKIIFGLAGKLEKRKQHHKVLKAWAKKYGNNPKYLLNCAITNPFITKEQADGAIKSVLDGKDYFNINFIDFMPTNGLYNDYLNNNDIIIGMSAAEGWGLPEFHSVGLGKHAVILNAHAYKDWANSKNSILVDPSQKIPAFDGAFFKEGQDFNQGSYFDWDEDDFLSACEEAEKRLLANKTNEEGIKLQKNFTWENTTKIILKQLGVE